MLTVSKETFCLFFKVSLHKYKLACILLEGKESNLPNSASILTKTKQLPLLCSSFVIEMKNAKWRQNNHVPKNKTLEQNKNIYCNIIVFFLQL